MLPSTTVVTRLHLWNNKPIMYVFCNKPLKAFLEGQMSQVIVLYTVLILSKCKCKSAV